MFISIYNINIIIKVRSFGDKKTINFTVKIKKFRAACYNKNGPE